jgi:hypothetical protein
MFLELLYYYWDINLVYYGCACPSRQEDGKGVKRWGFPGILACTRLSKDGSHEGTWNKDESVPLSVDVDEYFKFRI